MSELQRVRGLSMHISILLALLAGLLSAQPATRPPTPETKPAGPRAVIPADLYVDDDNGGVQDGTALRPFKTVKQAIDAAAANAVIAVAQGTYPQNIRIEGKAVRLYGGYVGGTAAGYAAGTAGNFTQRDPVAHPSHLKGDGKDSVITLYEAGASVIDGFLVTGGGRSSRGKPQWLGGGFYVYDGSPTISHNVIEKNQTCPPVPQDQEKLGGGIYATQASISILNNVIRNNVSGRGAGLAVDGPKVLIRDNTIENNVGVSDHGGGVYVFSPNAEISHNRIVGNEIGRKLGYGWGGGMIVFNQGGYYKLSHNVFTENFAPSVGSAFFVDEGGTASLDHDLFYANACNPAGNGAVPPVYVDGADDKIGSVLTMNHVTIVDHVCEPTVPGNAILVTGRSRAVIKNSLLWNNGGDDVEADAISQVTVSYTLSQEMLKGVGNLSKDPLFVDAAAHDYRLRSMAGRWAPAASGRQGAWVRDAQHSPAIDAAEPASPFNREPVPNGRRANLGTEGNSEQASKSAP